MSELQLPISFDGLGPIPSPKPSFAQGIGRDGSFAPIWTTEPKMPAQFRGAGSSAFTYPWKLIPTTETVGGVKEPRVRVMYGEVDGTPPDGMTLDTDYILDVGSDANTIIYLILTFDGNGLMTSVAIGYNTTLPDNTDDIKYMPIGVVSLVHGIYKINQQALTQYVYTEQALYINNSTESLVYSLFADPRKIHIINALENFVADIDGENHISKLYLQSEDNAEYIELKKDSEIGEVVVDGFSGSNAQNFILSANDTNSVSKLEIYDTDSTNFFTAIIDSTSKVSVRGYSNNEEQQFSIEADSTTGVSKSVLLDSGSTQYLESKVDTDNAKTSVYGYSGNNGQNFLISSDNTNHESKVSLYNKSSVQQIDIVADSRSGVESCYIKGYSNNEDGRFQLSSGTGSNQDPFLDLRNNDNYIITIGVDSDNDASKMFIKSHSGANALLKATADNASLYLGEPSTSNNVFIDVPKNDAGVYVDATWKVIDICVEGSLMKMKVLGTDPY